MPSESSGTPQGPDALQLQDGALRAHLEEAAWAAVRASASHVPLPAWAEPRPTGTPAGPGDAGSSVDPGDAGSAPPALVEALEVGGRAVVELEVSSAAGQLGALGVLRTDGALGSAVVRRLVVGPGRGLEAAQVVPGVEVSAFRVDDVVAEALRLLPEAPVPEAPSPDAGTEPQVGEVVVPEEFTVSLATALRRQDHHAVRLICDEAGFADVPPVVKALVEELVGSAGVSVRSVGRDDVTAGTWLLCSEGWVELSRTGDGRVRHRPVTLEDLRRQLLLDVAGRLSTAVEVSAS